ncbi:hypothetical protein WUBG_05412 [Wuchereria bancrofti]|uniref:Uncharacterized protein n=1 Tax=Wuchereria bancrofti TaxID=6293 RepID=J9B9C1_WUCBA|nr:hypothetical protein WUBG_05412 [Wuchereria bancrofti]
MPRRGFDSLRRMPIVVIPRKRKYKNYVSRRRNTKLIASLRRCFSDPLLYRSYNRWEDLSRPFLPEKPSSSFAPSAHAAPIAAIPEASSFDDSTMKVEAKTRKEFASLQTSKRSKPKEEVLFGGLAKSVVRKDEGMKVKFKGNGKLSKAFDLGMNKDGIAVNYPDHVIPKVNEEGESLIEVVLRAPTPPTTSRIRPRNLASRSVVLSRTTTIETPLIKRRLLGCAKYHEGSGSDRKDYHREYVNIPSGSNNLDEREEERTAERKAQNTVTAVTAAFSTLTFEPQQNEQEREAIAEQASNAGATTVVGTRGAERVRGGTGEVTIRSGVSETEKPVVPVLQQTLNISSVNNDNDSIGISGNSGQRKSRKIVPQSTRITLVPPPSIQKPKPPTKLFSHSSLLATLQLPASVSVKVDRIIANADRKEKERCSNHAPINSVLFYFSLI